MSASAAAGEPGRALAAYAALRQRLAEELGVDPAPQTQDLNLIREVMYATTPEPTRLAYHRRAADLLAGQPESLARHAAAAGDWPRAALAWLLAADEAMRRNAVSDAIALSTQALRAAERGGDAEARAAPWSCADAAARRPAPLTPRSPT
jgi:hypothetical protein